MGRFFSLIVVILLSAVAVAIPHNGNEVAAAPAGDPIDYAKAIMLDAESLAEGGIGQAYALLIEQSTDLKVDWLPLDENFEGQEQGSDEGLSYRVTLGGKTDFVFGSPPGQDHWAMATATFFDIVNRQLVDRPFKFYALMEGNDLQAIALTEKEFAAAKRYHAGTRYGPYLPTKTPPHYGAPQ
ncbi:MAG: hypothetical protein ACKO01_03290 [Erythrobacter sp.]